MKPQWESEIRQRLTGLHLASTREAAIVEELAQYLDDHYAELLAGGASEAEAYRQTLTELSGSELLAHELRRAEREVAPEPIVPGTNRRTTMIADIWQDLRFGARMLMNSPAFTLAAILSLAIGIGANTALFSVVNAILWCPLPYLDPERLVRVGEEGSAEVFAALRQTQRAFDGVAGWSVRDIRLTGRGGPAHLKGQRITPELLPLLGVKPQAGRAFVADEFQPGRDQVAIISHRLWQSRFGADPQIIGQAVTLDLQRYTIVGVTPPRFQSPYFLSRWIAIAGRTQSRCFRRIGLRTLLSPGPAILGSVFSFVLAPLFLINSKQDLFHSPNRCVFSL
jgi:hypothetical protein